MTATKVEAKGVLADLANVSRSVDKTADNVIHAATTAHQLKDVHLDKIAEVARHAADKHKALIKDLWDHICSGPGGAAPRGMRERVEEALK